MKLQKISVLTITLSILFAMSYAQNGGDTGISLSEAYTVALEKNAEVKNAALDVASAKKKVWETTAIGLPQVSASIDYLYNPEPAMLGSYSHDHDPVTNAPVYSYYEMPVGVKNSFTGTLTLSQLIFSGEYLVGLKAAKTYKRMSVEQLNLSQVQIKETIANSYFLALVSAEAKSNIDSSVIVMEQIYNETQAMQEAGFMDRTALDQMTLTYKTTKDMQQDLRVQAELALRTLAMNLGLPVDSLLVLDDNFETLMDLLQIETTPSVATVNLDNVIEYKVLNTAVDVQNLMRQQSMTKNLPTISAFYQHKYYFGNEPEVNFDPKQVVGVTVSIPIFSSGLRTSQYQQAKIEVEKAENTREFAGEGLKLAARNAMSTFNTSKGRFITERDNQELSKRILDNTIIKHKNGKASSMELAQANNQYLQTQGRYFQAVYTLLSSKIALDKSLGNL